MDSATFAPPRIERLNAADADAAVPALVDILIDCVEGGASVSFMRPMTQDKARGFWRAVLDSAARGERIVLVARDDGGVPFGTVQVVTDLPENQPHRGDVAKMLVHRRARRRGVARSLMQAAEAAAREAGRTLLVLDTVTGGAAESLYAQLGWLRCGVIPGYALMPDGEPCATTVFYKSLANLGSGVREPTQS